MVVRCKDLMKVFGGKIVNGDILVFRELNEVVGLWF